MGIEFLAGYVATAALFYALVAKFSPVLPDPEEELMRPISADIIELFPAQETRKAA